MSVCVIFEVAMDLRDYIPCLLRVRELWASFCQHPRVAAFFGDIHRNAYALDASNGELLWKASIDSQLLARVTGIQGFIKVACTSHSLRLKRTNLAPRTILLHFPRCDCSSRRGHGKGDLENLHNPGSTQIYREIPKCRAGKCLVGVHSVVSLR